MKLGTVTSSAYADALCAVMWVDGRDDWRLVRWLPAYVEVKNNAIRDKVRNIAHRLTPWCVVIVKKNGSVEVL